MESQIKTTSFTNLPYNDTDIKWGLVVTATGANYVCKQNTKSTKLKHAHHDDSPHEVECISESYKLVYILQGSGSFVSKSHEYTQIKDGNVIIIFPGERYTLRANINTGWKHFWIEFHGATIDNLINNGFFSKEQPIFKTGIQESIATTFHQTMATASEQNAGFQQILAGLVNQLLGYTHYYSRTLNNKNESTRSIDNLINNAKIIMHEALSCGITANEIAMRLEIGYSWFRHIFKEQTGFAPKQYILELRIERSKSLLTNSDKSVKAIAFESGFDNFEHFCHLFKKKTGMTPSQYRKYSTP